MKNILYILLLLPLLVVGQTESVNYVRTSAYKAPTTSSNPSLTITTVTYYDGLGRPIQQVAGKASPNNKDIITHLEYDQYNRQPKQYLPYEAGTGALEFDLNAKTNTEQLYLTPKYENTTNPYSQQFFEASPLNRVLKQAAPGNLWAGKENIYDNSDHTIKFEYQTNILNEVLKFGVSFTTSTEEPALVCNGYYPANQLYKNIVKDENWTAQDGKSKTTEEFKDKEGRLLLKRNYTRIPSDDNPSELIDVPHDTYYVYDDYSNLTYVIPPLAADQIVTKEPASRSASKNFAWTKLALVDSKLAEKYDQRLEEYSNDDILNVDLVEEYGGTGGYTIITNEDGLVTLNLNISTSKQMEYRNGVIASLDDFGDFKERELGRLKGEGYEYIFLIRNNAIEVTGEGRVPSTIKSFTNDQNLSYKYNYPWTVFANIDGGTASDYNKQLEGMDNEDILTVNFPNEYGASGGAAVAVAEDDTVTLSININSEREFNLVNGSIFKIKSERAVPNVVLGSVSGQGYNYQFSIENNNVVVYGDGAIKHFNFWGSAKQTYNYIVNEAALNLCYIYKYDRRNRIVEKHIPDNGWTYIIYDALDRPIWIQDETLRAKQQTDIDNYNWLYTKYDDKGRIAITGLTHNYFARSVIQDYFNNNNEPLYEVRTASRLVDGMNIYYGNSFSYEDKILTVNYYDDYNFDTQIAPSGTNVMPTANSWNPFDTRVKGLATGSVSRVLDNDGNAANDKWITSFSKFDKKARPIFTYSYNGYLNAYHSVESNLDFMGKILATKTQHRTGTSGKVIVWDYFDYDNADRPLKHTQVLGEQANGQRQLISWNKYDALGVAEQKKVGGVSGSSFSQYAAQNALQTIDYTKNIRGWLTGINKDSNISLSERLLSFTIDYGDLFNGNIAGTQWRTKQDSADKLYNYTYDGLNRLTDAVYKNYADPSVKFREGGIKYDKNGNILGLQRWGLVTVNNTYDKIDDLIYTYKPMSNQLMGVSDTAWQDGFKDGNTSGNDYDYTASGNLKYDLNKAIGGIGAGEWIKYNHLNLPYEIAKGSNKIEYVYDATGAKIQKKITDNGVVTITNYSYGYIYENNVLQYFSHPEGYVKRENNGTFKYVYQYKDHLGNVRLTYSDLDGNGIINDASVFKEDFEKESDWSAAYRATIALAPLEGYNSSSSGKLVNNFTDGGEVYCYSSNYITASNTEPTKYTYSGYIKSAGVQSQIWLYGKRRDGSDLHLDYILNEGTNGWQYVEQTVTVPADIIKLTLRVDTNIYGTVYFDDLTIRKKGDTSEIIETNDYYAFGMRHNNGVVMPNSSAAQRIKYNGKELQDELGLNWYDYQARNYDPALGRWFNIDPLAEKSRRYSPYTYALDNPVFFIDPDGMEAGPSATGYLSDLGADINGVKVEKFDAPVARKKDTKKKYNFSSYLDGLAKSVSDNDDIIFSDRKGNKLATYYDGKKEITNITLPIDNLGYSPNYQINNLMFGLNDIDAIGIGLSGSFAEGLGGSAGVEFLLFLDGKDKGQIFSYSYGGAIVGVAEGGGISLIGANFLGGDSMLSSKDYLGVFNAYSADVAGFGGSYFWGNNHNDPELYPGMANWWRDDYQKTWSGTSISKGGGANLNVGTTYYFYTPLINNILKKAGLQK